MRIIKTLEELPKTADTLLIVATYHKGKLLPRFRNTFDYVKPKELPFPCITFMQDKEDIERYSWLSDDWIIWAPEEPELTDLARVRWFIQTRVTDADYDTLYLLDDDMKFAWRDLWIPNKYHNVESFAALIGDFERTYDQMCVVPKHRIGIMGMPSRFGSSGITEDQWNKRVICFYRMSLKVLKENNVWFDWQQILMSDFHLDLSVAYAGLLSYTVAKYTRDGRENPKDEGGCNTYRNGAKALYEEMTKRLKNIFPEAVDVFFDNRNGYYPEGVLAPRIKWRMLSEISDKHWAEKYNKESNYVGK